MSAAASPPSFEIRKIWAASASPRFARKAIRRPSGAHRGPYLVLRFETVFERRHPVVETVTTVQGPDGRWRVAAYFLG